MHIIFKLVRRNITGRMANKFQLQHSTSKRLQSSCNFPRVMDLFLLQTVEYNYDILLKKIHCKMVNITSHQKKNFCCMQPHCHQTRGKFISLSRSSQVTRNLEYILPFCFTYCRLSPQKFLTKMAL